MSPKAHYNKQGKTAGHSENKASFIETVIKFILVAATLYFTQQAWLPFVQEFLK